MKKLSHLEDKIQQLPPYMIDEVENFLDFLLTNTKVRRNEKLTQEWAGALKEFSDKYTSLELQKKALEWIPFIFLIFLYIQIGVIMSRLEKMNGFITDLFVKGNIKQLYG